MENQAVKDKKTTLVMFKYDDGSYEYAIGDHAVEVMEWLNAAQSMLCIHGGDYSGRKMIEVPAAPQLSDLESVASIAELVFPEAVEEIRNQ